MVFGIGIGTFLLLATLFGLWLRKFTKRASPGSKTVAIVVLGDIGRSPRMLYHAQSFASHEYTTYIIAYKGSKPPDSLIESPHVRFVYLSNPLAFASKSPKPLFLCLLPFKILGSAVSLLLAIQRLEVTPSFILVQNPPAIPTLPVVKLAAFKGRSRVIIDWHNTGYSVLALRLGETSWVVKLAKLIETFWGRDAYLHLCVTRAMKNELVQKARIRGKVQVFHDRPPSHFRRLTAEESHKLFLDLPFSPSSSNLAAFFGTNGAPAGSSKTLFTISDPHMNSPQFLVDRPKLVVSATSWTADEDFDILLRALDIYDVAAAETHSQTQNSSLRRLPKLMVVITGKGAGQADFETKVKLRESGERSWSNVRVRTAWLQMEDYPKLLGSADLGISLHASTSGIDLPMKVVDMFGCGLPVCALDFPCIDELVIEGSNGMIFRTADILAEQLQTLLGSSASQPSPLDHLRSSIKEANDGGKDWCSWEQNWDNVITPLLKL